MKVYLLLVLVLLYGCASKYQPVALHDGRYGEYNSAVAEECAVTAISLTDNPLLQAKMFNQCVFDMGITI
jgi:hypothetical protein